MLKNNPVPFPLVAFLTFILCNAVTAQNNWTRLDNAPGQAMFTNMYADADTIIGGGQHGLYYSHDGGRHLRPIEINVPGAPASYYGYVVDKFANTYYCFAGNIGLLQSRDGGVHWDPLDLPPGLIPNISWSAADNYLAGAPQGLYITNGTTIWLWNGNDTPTVLLQNPNQLIHSLYFADNRLYFATGDGKLIRLNADNTVSQIFDSNGEAVEHVAFHGDSLWIRGTDFNGNERYYRTLDGGQNWSTITTVFPGFEKMHWFKGRLYGIASFTNADGLYISNNLGNNWQKISGNIINSGPIEIYAAGDRLYVGSWDGLWVNENGEAQWRTYNQGLPISSYADFQSRQSILSYNYISMFLSADSGNSWVSDPFTVYANNIVTHKNAFYRSATGLPFRLYRTTAADLADWDTIQPAVNMAGSYGTLLSDNTNMYYITGGTSRTYRSEDDGQTWVDLGATPSSISDAVISAGRLYIQSTGGILYGSLNGTNWIQENFFGGKLMGNEYGVMTATSNRVMWKPTGSNTWNDITQQLPCISYDENDVYLHGPYLFIFCNQQVFRLDLNAFEVLDLTLDLPISGHFSMAFMDNTVFALTGNGIYQLKMDDFLETRIAGEVYIDENYNGQRDAGDSPFPFAVIRSSHTYLNTDSTGHFDRYILLVQDTLRPVFPNLPCQVTPEYTLITGAPSDTSISFGVQLLPPGGKDLTIAASYSPLFRRGFISSLTMQVTNIGATVQSAQVFLKLDPFMEFIDSEPAAAWVNGDTVMWELGPIPLQQSRQIKANIRTRITATVNQLLSYQVWVMPDKEDLTPANNRQHFREPIVGSYDPNDKQVSPEYYSSWELGNRQPLTYTIRFQNLGNYYAEFVRVIDTLSELLDPSTIRVLVSSHPCSWQLTGKGIVEWYFPNIMLPAAEDDELRSHGFVQFSILPRGDIVPGTVIPNFADIYFDYNEPVRTNTAETLLRTGRRITPGFPTTTGVPIELAPNPSSDRFVIQTPGGPGLLEAYDNSGRKVLQMQVDDFQTEVDVRRWPNGVYRIVWQAGSVTHEGAIAVQR